MLLFLKGNNSNGKYVFRTNNNETIYIKDIDTEKLCYLEESLNYIENALNYKIQSFTVDGRKGVIELLEKRYNRKIPIQLCNFHQIKTILTYTTKNPKTDCGKDLKKLTLTLTNKRTTEFNFIQDFNYLREFYKDFLKEKTEKIEKKLIEKTNKKTGEVIYKETKETIIEYKHPRLRSAFRSLKTNLPYLFTYKKEENERLKIPNTTNGCDGKFGRVKIKIKNHTGLRLKRKEKMFDKLIS